MGEESIPRLLVEFSAPVMTGMIVQAIYNVVNRMFIGNAPEAATLGIAAITLSMPIALACMAFAGLVGFGGAAALSIYLGEGDGQRSERALGNGASLALAVGAGLTVAGLLALEPILRALGATREVLPFARDYNRILLLGSIPSTLGFALTNFIRAEGNPGRSMRIMIAGAACNVALDALFIPGLRMGVAGAALGTVLSQTLVAALAAAHYASRAGVVRFRAANLRIEGEIARRCLGLGSSGFILHVGNSLLNFVLNGQVARYGGDVGLAALGVVQSVGLFFLFPIFGINGGSQPLIGYNHGARRFDRVRSAARWAIAGAAAIAVAAFAAIQTAAHGIAGLFSGGDRALLELSASGLRIAYLLLPFVGFQIVAANYFTAVGKPLQAMLFTLCRQLLFLVPLAYALPRFLGLEGVFLAMPAADGLAVLVTAGFFLAEMRALGGRAGAAHKG